VTVFLENGRILQNIPTRDSHGFSGSYLDLGLENRRLDLAVNSFFDAAFRRFAPPLPNILMPPIEVGSPPRPAISLRSREPRFPFWKSSGKLSIRALTRSTAESKV